MGNLTMTVVASATAMLMSAPSTLADFDAAVRAAYSGDYHTAEMEFRRLADQQDPRGQNGLGVLYLRGDGVAQDLDVAVDWIRRSADQGFRAAQTNLGLLYENGWGVERDDSLAYRWYFQAAVQGDSEAQTSLGVMCAQGRGTVKDYNNALVWFRRAAKLGNVDAWANIGHMYRAGDSVQRDYLAAFAWYGIAAAAGYPMGPELRDTVAGYLTETELEQARAMARSLYHEYSGSLADADGQG